MVMTPSPDEVAAPAWTIRPELPIDLDQIHELHRAAFNGSAEAELVDAIRSGPDFLSELSLVAVTADDSVLGHILVSRVALQPEDGTAPIDVLALAPLAVLPPHQGRGIGAGLMREALAAVDRREEPMTIVLGSPSFYEAFGFVPALPYEIHGPYDDAGDAFQVRLGPDLDPEDVPGGLVVYPAMFGAV
jgi:predicted N-acetyltransferase YhbS